MKLIFLDIDGVLNSEAFWERHLAAGGRGGYEGLDRGCIERVNRLVEGASYPVRIVLSSSWRGSRETLHTIELAMRERGALFPLHDQTPVHPSGDRAAEIWAYLHKLAWTGVPDRIVILDDDDVTAEAPTGAQRGPRQARRMLRGRLVRTDCRVGLTDADVARALSLLG